MKYTSCQLAVFVFGGRWFSERPSSKYKNPGSFDYQHCPGSERQTLVGNGRNWTAENQKFSSWQHSSSRTLPFGFQVFVFSLFSHSISRLPLGSLITVHVCILDLLGNEMEWFFLTVAWRQSAARKTFTTTRWSSKRMMTCRGWGRKGHTFSSPFHLAILAS